MSFSNSIDREKAQLFLRVQRENARLEEQQPVTLEEFPTLWRQLKTDTDSYPYPRTREQDMELYRKNHRFAAKHQYFYYQTVNHKINSEYIEEMIDLKCNKMHHLSKDEVMRLATDINIRHGLYTAK